MFRKIYKKIFPHHIRGRNNIVDINKVGRKVRIYINGNNNVIKIEEVKCLLDLQISIFGDNNYIEIKKHARIYGPCLIRAEFGSKIMIDQNVGLRGVTMLAKNARISIGADCMTSYNVIIRNHDSHDVLSIVNGEPVNPSKDIVIGKHVWLAQNTTILKGVNIGSNSIVGFGAVVTKNIPDNSIAAGNPAKVVKSDVTWKA